MIPIQQIWLPVPGIEQLRDEALGEGYRFLDTLVEEWESGKNRFDGRGEILCGHLDRGHLVAVGGLTLDPFAGRADTGRIRRVYVSAAWRNRGVGRALMTALIAEARKSFRRVRLRAENDDAARLYERLGFARITSLESEPGATHLLGFETATGLPGAVEKTLG